MSEFLRSHLPEASRISGLLADLNQKALTAAQESSPPTKPAKPTPRRQGRKARPIRSLPLLDVMERVNWRNDPGAAQPLWLEPFLPGGKLLRPAGSLLLGELFSLVNWTNNAKPPEWPTIGTADPSAMPATPASIESVLSTFSWGD